MPQYYRPSRYSKSDPYIRDIQLKLNAIKAQYHGNWDYLITDGIYGPKSGEAVKAFQIYKNITPASGELGPTTSKYINQVYNSLPTISNASPTLRAAPIKKKLNSGDIVGNIGNAADLGTLLMDGSLPWIKQFVKSFPMVFYKIKDNPKAPLVVFSKNDAYHRFGQIYKRVDIRNIGENVPDYLSKIGYICQLLMLKSKIEEYKKNIYRNNNFDWALFTKTFAEMGVLITGSADLIAKEWPKFVRKYPYLEKMIDPKNPLFKKLFTYSAAEGGAAFSLGAGATLSTIGQCIGAFLLGWEIGTLIGKIPCGNGKNVQYYIDRIIETVWDNPYKTIGWIPPSGPAIATGIAAWKKAIEWNVNSVKLIKPLTEEEKRKLEQFKLQHPEKFIPFTP